MNSHEQRIPANRAFSASLAGIGVAGALLCVLSGNHYARDGGLALCAIFEVKVALWARPGASIVLNARELRVRGAVRWHTIPYAAISEVGRVRGSLGQRVGNPEGPFAWLEEQYFRVRVDGRRRGLRIIAVQSAVPLRELRTKLHERCHRSRSKNTQHDDRDQAAAD
ncbi:MAG TPA: hypothetical protein VGI86_05450 [Acidimicrobiia bacterium]|jgi:hypothetical protein